LGENEGDGEKFDSVGRVGPAHHDDHKYVESAKTWGTDIPDYTIPKGQIYHTIQYLRDRYTILYNT